MRSSGPLATRSTRRAIGITIEEAIAARCWGRTEARSVEDRTDGRRRPTRTTSPHVPHRPRHSKRRGQSACRARHRSRRRAPPASSDDKQLTVDDLVAWYLEVAREDRGLDHSTLTGYAHAYSHWLKEPIGHKRASSITMAELDKAFGRMRRAGLSRSRMNNARALLSGAFKMGQASRQGDEQPRRWLRVADQHAHTASHHGAGVG